MNLSRALWALFIQSADDTSGPFSSITGTYELCSTPPDQTRPQCKDTAQIIPVTWRSAVTEKSPHKPRLNHHLKCDRRARRRRHSPGSGENREVQTRLKKAPTRLQWVTARLHFKYRGRVGEPIAAPALWPGSRTGAQQPLAKTSSPLAASRRPQVRIGREPKEQPVCAPGRPTPLLYLWKFLLSPGRSPPLPSDLGLREVVAGSRGTWQASGLCRDFSCSLPPLS